VEVRVLFWALNGNTVTSMKFLGTKDNFALPFITNNAERMRITNTGNVSIGSTTANYKFNVIDTINPFAQTLVQGGTAGGGVLTRLQNNTREYAIGVGGSGNGTLGADALFIRDMTSGINRIVVASTTGNVGIGNFAGTMPARRLEVQDSTGNIARFVVPAIRVRFPVVTP
jgi:hypothetical protein